MSGMELEKTASPKPKRAPRILNELSQEGKEKEDKGDGEVGLPYDVSLPPTPPQLNKEDAPEEAMEIA